MSVPTRKVAITYGGLTIGVGGTSGYVLHDVHRLEESYTSFSFEATVVLQASSAASLLTLDTNLRAAWTKPDQSDFVVAIGGSNFVSYSHSANSWLNPAAELVLLDRFRSQLSRAYLFRLTAELPADLSGRAGRRDSSWRVGVLPTGQKTLSIQATYTALTTPTTAYATAVADFTGTYVAAIQTIAGGTWVESQAVEYEADDQNKVCRASAVYQQRLINDSALGAADSTIEVRSYRCVVERPEGRVARNSGARPLVSVRVLYDVDVQTSTTLPTAYETSVLPYLSTLVTSHTDAQGSPVVASESPEFDPWASRISGSVTYLVAETRLLTATKRISGTETTGTSLAPKLDRQKQFLKQKFEGPRVRTRSIEIFTRELAGGDSHKQLVDAATKEALAAGYHHLVTDTVVEDLEVPNKRGNVLRLVERGSVIRLEYGELDKTSSGGGRRRPITQPGGFGRA